MLAPSDELRRLACAIAAPFSGEAASIRIDSQLARFAIERHRVGPLLDAAARGALGRVDAEAGTLLAEHFRANAHRVAITDLILQGLADGFAAARIPWLVLKGLPLARKLYPEISWRQTNDIDILVPAKFIPASLRLLESAQFLSANPKLPVGHWLVHFSARLSKDVTLRHAIFKTALELHSRLFFGQEIEARSARLRQAFVPRVTGGKADIPSPEVGIGLGLYLLLHGAVSHWFRLKWLVDLVPLFAKLDDASLRAIADSTEDLGAATSVKASLMLFRSIFAAPCLGPLEAWLAENTARKAIDARARAYLAALDNPSHTVRSPANDRFEGLKAQYRLIDKADYRAAVLLRAPLSSALSAFFR